MDCRGLFYFAVLFLILAMTSRAQYGSFGLTDARQLGLGNTYVSNSRELYAAGKNPSLLAFSAYDRKVDLLFPNLSARAYNINRVSDFFNDFFSQEPLDLISGIDGSMIKRAFDNNGKLFLGLQIGYISAGYTPGAKAGSFSFAMKDYINGLIQLPKSIMEYSSGDINYSGIYFQDFRFRSSWTRAYELSWGKAFTIGKNSGIQAVYAGVGVKYLVGFIYHDIEFSGGVGYADEQGIFSGTYTASSLSAYSEDIDISNSFEGQEVISHVPFMAPVGRGFSMDAGIMVLLDPGVKAAVSITDAGIINWEGRTKKTLVSGVIRLDSNISIEDIDSLSKQIRIEKETYDDFRTSPAGALHVGFSFMIERFVRNFPGAMNIAVELHQGFAKSLENPEQPRLAMGIDWKPGRKWPVLLTGLTNGLQGGVAWSVGIGYELKFLEIYISSPNILPRIENSDFQTLSLSACWHFVK